MPKKLDTWHVAPRKSHWTLRRDGASRSHKSFDTWWDAVDYVKDNMGGKVYLHNLNAEVMSTFDYPDPNILKRKQMKKVKKMAKARRETAAKKRKPASKPSKQSGLSAKMPKRYIYLHLLNGNVVSFNGARLIPVKEPLARDNLEGIRRDQKAHKASCLFVGDKDPEFEVMSHIKIQVELYPIASRKQRLIWMDEVKSLSLSAGELLTLPEFVEDLVKIRSEGKNFRYVDKDISKKDRAKGLTKTK